MNEPMPTQTWPTGYSTPDKQKELAIELCSRAKNGLFDREARRERWDRNRAFYFSEGFKSDAEDFEGASDEFLNIVQYIVDGLGTHVVGTITSQKPYCQATLPATGTDAAEALGKVQRAVWFFMERGKIQQAIQKVGTPAGWSNAGHIKVEWDEAKLKPKFTVYEPDEVVVYPATVKSLEDATFYGTRLWRRKSEIEKLQSDGVYLSGSVTSFVDPGQAKEQQYQSVKGEIKHTPVNTGDSLVELWRGCFTDQEGATWWVTLSPQDDAILKLDKVPEEYLDTDTFKFGFKNETGTGYWDKGSVAQDIQGGQLQANGLLNMLLNGLKMNSYGVGFLEGYPGASTIERYNPGDLVAGPGMGSVQMFSPRADLSYVANVMWDIVSHQEKVGRLAPSGVGGQFKSGTTATAAGLAGQGQQAGVNEYISVFGDPLTGDNGIFAYVQSLLGAHFKEWQEEFGPLLGIEEGDFVHFRLPIEWQLSASTPSATPQAQIQAVQTLLPLAHQMPGLGLDQYKLGTALVKLAQDLGVLGAGDFQLPADPSMFIQAIAAKTGIPPELLAEAIKNAQSKLQAIQQAHQANQGNQAQAAPPGRPGLPGVEALPGMAPGVS